VTAYLLSPLLPIGLAGDAEPHPGFAFDATAILLGALATALIVGAAATIPAWRSASVARGRARASADAQPSAIASALRRSAAPVTVATGVRMALEPGRGRTSVPVRTTVAGAVLAVAALATALVFGSSLDHLLATPNLYGVTWDARLSSPTSNDVSQSLPLLATDRRVEDVAVGFTGFAVDVGNTRLEGVAIRATKGDLLMPVPIQGRAPEQPDEVMLGTRTIKDLHTRIGGTLTAALGGTGKTSTFRVVGVGVFPPLDDSLTLGKGVATTVDALMSALPAGSPVPSYDSAFLRFAPGVDKPAAIGDLDTEVTASGETVTVPQKPVDLVNFGRVQELPLVLSALLGALAAATLAHLLATSVRRRRRDLALLKTLGFVPRQVRWTVAWQASTLAVASLVVGVPIGIVAGRFVWTAFGHQLGILPAPSIGVVRLAALAVGTVIVANLVALLPGRVAAHTRPAEILRSE
jgi:hypothetical protein